MTNRRGWWLDRGWLPNRGFFHHLGWAIGHDNSGRDDNLSWGEIPRTLLRNVFRPGAWLQGEIRGLTVCGDDGVSS
jgi:hypothetical protein